ncbi:MAG TPA: hypothetical protein VFE69_03405, partial [Ilumatobacteraceae bacterium]|nr:hypothetical protein [Ilumatobacteraceae bacterium]
MLTGGVNGDAGFGLQRGGDQWRLVYTLRFIATAAASNRQPLFDLVDALLRQPAGRRPPRVLRV